MIVPQFTFDAEANGYISEPIVIDRGARVHIELVSRAPVVTLKMENDGGYANYGQPSKQASAYNININAKEGMTIRLATPVEITKCYVLN